jgi:hypothetical protein
MTMKVTIKNEDPTRTARVTCYDRSKGVEEGNIYFPTHQRGEQTELLPGESKEFWIHSGRDLKVEEV